MILLIIFILCFLFIFYNFFKTKEKYDYEKYDYEKYIYTAVIVEPRKHKAFEFVLLNFLENLDEKWKFLIFHGTTNKDYIENIINKYPKYKPKIKLINLGIENMTVSDYNNLLYTEDFYNNIDTEVFLIFQTDSMICSDNKHLINNFIKYDYVGAPWNFKEENNNVGNGGLSLRRKKKMLEILRNCHYIKNSNEDMFFAYGCENHVPYKPSFEEAKKFSIETIFSENSFGNHKSWLYLPNHIDTMKNNCKGYDKLIEYNF